MQFYKGSEEKLAIQQWLCLETNRLHEDFNQEQVLRFSKQLFAAFTSINFICLRGHTLN